MEFVAFAVIIILIITTINNLRSVIGIFTVLRFSGPEIVTLELVAGYILYLLLLFH